MKKNLLWLLLLVPAIFIAASSPFTNDIESSDNEGYCVNWDELDVNYDGNSGCGYFCDFSFTFTGNCTLEDIDLDRNTAGVQHYFQNQYAEIWTTGNDGVIVMLPKSGYGGPPFPFVYTCNVNVHFEDDIVEYAKWTINIIDYAGPYPAKCD